MSDANPQVSNVPDAFNRIRGQGAIGELVTGDTSFPPGGHLQGIQRSYVTKNRAATMIISSSSDSESYFFVGSLPLPFDSDGLSAPACAWESEGGGNAETVVYYHKLCDAPLKHAGGIQVIERYLVVGVEDNSSRDRSRVLFYEISDPASPQQLRHLAIERSGSGLTAGAVGIVKRGSDHLLVVGRWDSEVLDFYVSNGSPLCDMDCQFSLWRTWDSSDADRSDWSPDHVWGSHQSLNLVRDTSGDLYLLGFNRDEEGRNVLDLFRLDISQGTSKMIQKLRIRTMHCHPGVSFGYGAGIFITPNGLAVYACEGDPRDSTAINEFWRDDP